MPDSVIRWARIRQVGLEVEDRLPNLPSDTAAKPFDLWINGWLEGEGVPGDSVVIRTLSGREVWGTLVEETPGYSHTFGKPPLALKLAGENAHSRIWGDR